MLAKQTFRGPGLQRCSLATAARHTSCLDLRRAPLQNSVDPGRPTVAAFLLLFLDRAKLHPGAVTKSAWPGRPGCETVGEDSLQGPPSAPSKTSVASAILCGRNTTRETVGEEQDHTRRATSLCGCRPSFSLACERGPRLFGAGFKKCRLASAARHASCLDLRGAPKKTQPALRLVARKKFMHATPPVCGAVDHAPHWPRRRPTPLEKVVEKSAPSPILLSSFPTSSSPCLFFMGAPLFGFGHSSRAPHQRHTRCRPPPTM